MMVVEFFVKKMANLDSGGNYLYVEELSRNSKKIGAPYYMAIMENTNVCELYDASHKIVDHTDTNIHVPDNDRARADYRNDF